MGSDILPRILLQDAGPANVVQTLGQLAEQNRLPYKAVGVLDGDQEESAGCIRLPGTQAPERTVFGDLRNANWPNLSERFGIGAGQLFTFLEDSMLEPEHHRWPEMVGDKVLKSATSVWEILASQWCAKCLSDDERNRIVDQLKHLLDQHRRR